MTEIPNLRLSLFNKAEDIPLVRQALSGLATAIELDPVELNDLSTAVTEACNNVVLHAYGGETGQLEVDVYLHPPVGLRIVVRDHGKGIGEGLSAPSAEMLDGGIGMPVIQALSERVEFRNLAGKGTEVVMDFTLTASRPGAIESCSPAQEPGFISAAAAHEELASTLAMTIAPNALASAIVPRVLSALAVRAYFSTDRIADMQLLAATLLSHASDPISTSPVSVSALVGPRNLQLRIGPLRAGSASTLLFDSTATDGLGHVLERLADSHEVSPAGASEMLALQIDERD